MPELIVRNIKILSKYGLLKENVRILGSEDMFKKDQSRRPLAEILRREKLRVVPPRKYDEYGAISLGVQMFKNDRIIIHKDCERSREDINLWSIKGKLEVNGFCEAILLILSEVREQKKKHVIKAVLPDYSPVRAKREDTSLKHEWMAR